MERVASGGVEVAWTHQQNPVGTAVACPKTGQRCVLVVDDEPSIRRFLRHWLEGWALTVKEAGSASEALAVMLAEPTDIVLCDIRMPGHDGLWLMDKIRLRWPRTALIMATSVDTLDVVMKSHRGGAVDYVTKPFGRELLRQALCRAEAKLAG